MAWYVGIGCLTSFPHLPIWRAFVFSSRVLSLHSSTSISTSCDVSTMLCIEGRKFTAFFAGSLNISIPYKKLCEGEGFKLLFQQIHANPGQNTRWAFVIYFRLELLCLNSCLYEVFNAFRAVIFFLSLAFLTCCVECWGRMRAYSRQRRWWFRESLLCSQTTGRSAATPYSIYHAPFLFWNLLL